MKKNYLYPHPTVPGKMISRQRVWQLRKVANGRCYICGQDAVLSGYRCLKHAIAATESGRKLKGCKRRNWNAKIYQLYKPKQTK